MVFEGGSGEIIYIAANLEQSNQLVRGFRVSCGLIYGPGQRLVEDLGGKACCGIALPLMQQQLFDFSSDSRLLGPLLIWLSSGVRGANSYSSGRYADIAGVLDVCDIVQVDYSIPTGYSERATGCGQRAFGLRESC